MIPIQQLLERFRNLPNTEKVKKEAIIEIFNKASLPVKINQITLSKKTILIKTRPIIKTEIILQKNKLLKQIEKALGEGVYTEIQ